MFPNNLETIWKVHFSGKQFDAVVWLLDYTLMIDVDENFLQDVFLWNNEGPTIIIKWLVNFYLHIKLCCYTTLNLHPASLNVQLNRDVVQCSFKCNSISSLMSPFVSHLLGQATGTRPHLV